MLTPLNTMFYPSDLAKIGADTQSSKMAQSARVPCYGLFSKVCNSGDQSIANIPAITFVSDIPAIR